MGNIAGKVVVIMGVSSGLGESTARHLAELGATVVLGARRNLTRPTTTQGHIGAVLPDKIVYDAETTSGGSSGPLFNNEGKVIGINVVVLREFGGSNFAIPVSFGQSLSRL